MMRLTRSRSHTDPASEEPHLAARMSAGTGPRAMRRPVEDDLDAWPHGGSPSTGSPTFRRGDRPSTAPTDDPGHIGHHVLGAGWADGRLWSLERVIHPGAWLRTGLSVAAGPGAVMAAALADLGRIETPVYYAEATLRSDTGPDDLCPRAHAAMDAGAPPPDGTILSLRGSLTGRIAGEAAAMPGADMRLRVMADLWCADGQVRDGWILRDTAAEAAAAGLRPADWARARMRAAGAADRLPTPLTPDSDPEGPYVARSPGGRHSAHGDALADRLRRIMDGDIDAVGRDCDPACEHTLPGGITCLGSGPARAFWAGLRAALPGAAFRVEHRHGSALPGAAPQAAVRWSLYGRHDGPGRFGQPTGCFLHVLGMTQVEMGPLGIRRAWTLIDDCAVWTQIALAAAEG